MATLAEADRATLDIVVLGDEVPEHICYEGQHQSLCWHPELAARSIVVLFVRQDPTSPAGGSVGHVVRPAGG